MLVVGSPDFQGFLIRSPVPGWRQISWSSGGDLQKLLGRMSYLVRSLWVDVLKRTRSVNTIAASGGVLLVTEAGWR
ncbi:MAG TPA: hypothetical protein IGS52_09515 [Oscillatoriaceae cyanobacterium M33_DOE_052]|uniref:Uncharacterized protein n=1 Tax=Planktothricoides sp. SpSt-374 TaxID=2282167 RepID=A0A7C3ZJ27_9CYAN|nr:hypothetical protein [Oscillatoriaceae cyanobacterium M33_DOE_052]